MTWHVSWSQQATKQLLSIEKRQRLTIPFDQIVAFYREYI